MGEGGPFLAHHRTLGMFSFRMLWIDYSELLPFYSMKQPLDSVLTGHRFSTVYSVLRTMSLLCARGLKTWPAKSNLKMQLGSLELHGKNIAFLEP